MSSFHLATKIVFFLLVAVATASRADVNALEIQQVTPHVYALVGKRGPMTVADLGTNATFGVIVAKHSVVLVDPGASYKGAERIHEAIRTITDKPVRFVINTGGEDQRWLGNIYFSDHGAKIIAAEAAVSDQRKRASDQLSRLAILLGEKGIEGTKDVYADTTFNEKKDLLVDGMHIAIRRVGPAYTPGDAYVWLADEGVVFTGDIVFVERLPTISTVSNTLSWIKAFELISSLKPAHIVPGHGHVTTLSRARADTLDYIVALRRSIKSLIDEDVGLEEVGKVDQSKFHKLIGYEMLKGRNAQQVYQEMEWE